MLRSVKYAVVAALAVTLVAVLAAGCGSESSSGDASASPSAAAVDKTAAFKVGISQIVTHPALDATVQGIQDELAAQGFTGIQYDVQNAEGDMPTTASIAQKFAGDGLDLAIGVATPTSQALAKVITTDPVGAGLVQDPEAPSGNVTGVSDMQPVKPILELAQTFRPDAKAVGMVYNAGESNSVFLVEQAEKDAAGMGLTIVKAPASTSAEVQAAAQSLVGRVDAIAVIGDNTAVSALESIIKVCEQNQIPTASSAAPWRATASTTTTWGSRPARWPPSSSAALQWRTSRSSSPRTCSSPSTRRRRRRRASPSRRT
jgi:putative ABC transport system substrate-binding protein